ncbi:hypothetical protein PVAND_000803 [Polypedilum vanderplanki]|uniref:PHD-type domain-containing protein n=1 Tax=Polypedilum vanderplanki TaxID=319348 RepID=A0A9J6BLA9_POLVA|nr:hypothetical protein PVAND_000803 [Polypedilum vanderplanki]
MENTNVIESYLSQAIKLLHSSAPDSAEKMRMILENEIEKNYSKEKTLKQSLSKKQLEQISLLEMKAVGSGFKLKKQKTKKVEEETKKVETPPVINENQQIIKIRDDEDDNMSSGEEDESTSAIDLLSDLTCVSCRQMDSSANNQLFECVSCQQLYHQLCHIKKIPNETNASSWVCYICAKGKKEKEGSNKSTKSYESSSSSSSTSNNKQKEKEKEKITKEKEREKDRAEKRKHENSGSGKSSKKLKESTSTSSSRSRSSKK